jgi:hypothetical protein
MKKFFVSIALLLGFSLGVGAGVVHQSSLDGVLEPSAVLVDGSVAQFDGPPDPICPLPVGCPGGVAQLHP